MKLMLRSLLFIFGLALLANALWLYEIVQLIGWEGASWLTEPHYSIYGINLLVILAYLTPVYLEKKPSWAKLILAGIELYALGMVAYLIAKAVLYTILGNIFGFLNLYSTLGILALIPFLTAISFYLVTKRQLYAVSSWVLVPLGLSMALPLFLSWVTLKFLPGFSQGSDFGYAEAVKMGYPFFWITLLMGICSLFSLRYFQQSEVKASQPDILDDLAFSPDENGKT